MASEHVLSRLRDVLTTQSFGVLATSGRTTPYVNLVAFAVSPDLKTVWFATPRATRKYENLQTVPQVAMLIDSRANDIHDLEDAVAVTVLGDACELGGADLVSPQEIYLAKHPGLRDFVSAPSCALFALQVSKYIVVSSFQHVEEVEIP